MTRANIVTFIDLQNGFARYDIPQDKGGCLYVPGGENAAMPAAELIQRSKNTVFILSQDFHPDDHISFMENHSGVMELRRAQLKGKVAAEEMETAILDPRVLPFTAILVKKHFGKYAPVACEIDGQWRKAETNYDGHIVHIENSVLSKEEMRGTFAQTLWRRHCVQGSESALFDPRIMEVLPNDLRRKIEVDKKSSVLQTVDANGNTFFVVRKGMRDDLDSYGIATENDGIFQTQAPSVFGIIAAGLKQNGVTQADIDVGGLATNFCVEYSENVLHTLLVPALQEAGIAAKLHFLTDISAGIPISIADGSWPDLAGAEKRMSAHGTDARTTQDVMRASISVRRSHATAECRS